MEGSRLVEIEEHLTLGCMSDDARALLETIMAAWQVHEAELRASRPNYTPDIYGFAYWLCRYSGLVEPAQRSRRTEPQE